VAPNKPSRPLYEVFLERVIKIDAVQRHRAAVTENHVGDFFEFGRVPGQIGKYRWPLDGAPEPFPRGIVMDDEKKPMSPAMESAWNAAVAAKNAFVAKLRAGGLIATATYATTGARRDLEPAEWMRTGLVLEVRDGTLFTKGRDGEPVELWSAIMLRDATEQPVEPTVELLPVKPANKLGRVDWNDWWAHEIARQDILPSKKAYLDEAEALIKQRYGVAHVELSELRRICAALYRGDSERPRRKRQSHKRPQSRSKSP
jgi:hypothetical protein